MNPHACSMYCRRCDHVVDVIVPWRGWKPALVGWYAMMGLLVVLFPFMASDYCVMIPTMMAIILAGSPLHRLAKEKPVCRTCSLELDGERGGTMMRARQ
ncbi:hypothetical protein [Sandaracinus amylolyticus]|uniref:hypothetical protein n=1 Tax=Sandaracinus amylolyticus TaxID=927083 RepID=UPI001470551A|nr:hypothetical protein [Sandaracinus amylolyticus]